VLNSRIGRLPSRVGTSMLSQGCCGGAKVAFSACCAPTVALTVDGAIFLATAAETVHDFTPGSDHLQVKLFQSSIHSAVGLAEGWPRSLQGLEALVGLSIKAGLHHRRGAGSSNSPRL